MGETDDLEWDDIKDAVNHAKHGLPLLLAMLLFDGRPRVDRVSRHPPQKAGSRRSPRKTATCYRVYGRGGHSGGVSSPFGTPIGRNAVPTNKQLEEAERLWKTVDWEKLRSMTDEEIRQAWAWDPDMTWPTDEEMEDFDLVIPAKVRRETAAARETAKTEATKTEAARPTAEAATGADPAKPKDAAE